MNLAKVIATVLVVLVIIYLIGIMIYIFIKERTEDND